MLHAKKKRRETIHGKAEYAIVTLDVPPLDPLYKKKHDPNKISTKKLI